MKFWSRLGMLCWRHFKYTAGNQPTFLKYKSRSRPVTRHVTTAISWIAPNVVNGKCVRDSKLSSEREYTSGRLCDHSVALTRSGLAMARSVHSILHSILQFVVQFV